MTLNDIVVTALRRLGRGDDQQTIQEYSAVFIDYANLAIRLIAERYDAVRADEITLAADKTFTLDDLPRECRKIVDVLVGGKSITFYQYPPNSGTFLCETEAETVTVTYRFYPLTISSPSETPELPSFTHRLIPLYVVACERCGGDPNTQNTASADFQLFNAFLRGVGKAQRGDPKSYKLLNY